MTSVSPSHFAVDFTSLPSTVFVFSLPLVVYSAACRTSWSRGDTSTVSILSLGSLWVMTSVNCLGGAWEPYSLRTRFRVHFPEKFGLSAARVADDHKLSD